MHGGAWLSKMSPLEFSRSKIWQWLNMIMDNQGPLKRSSWNVLHAWTCPWQGTGYAMPRVPRASLRQHQKAAYPTMWTCHPRIVLQTTRSYDIQVSGGLKRALTITDCICWTVTLIQNFKTWDPTALLKSTAKSVLETIALAQYRLRLPQNMTVPCIKILSDERVRRLGSSWLRVLKALLKKIPLHPG